MLSSQNPYPPPGGWLVIDQFFAEDIPGDVSGGSPPVALEVTPGGYVDLDVRGGAKASASAVDPRDDEYPISQATPGQWQSLLLHVHWSTGSGGLVQVWNRGADGSPTSAPAVSATGPNVLTVGGDVLPVYAETGIYRSHTSSTQVVYYNGVAAAPTAAAALTSFARRTSTTASCQPTNALTGQAACSVSVADVDSGTRVNPSGTVELSPSPLPIGGSCSLKPATNSTTASDCVLDYAPSLMPVDVVYAGDDGHQSSSAPLPLTADASSGSPAPTTKTGPTASTNTVTTPTTTLPTLGATSTPAVTAAGGVPGRQVRVSPGVIRSIAERLIRLLSQGGTGVIGAATCKGGQLTGISVFASVGGRRAVLATGSCTAPNAVTARLALRLTASGRLFCARMASHSRNRRLAVVVVAFGATGTRPARKHLVLRLGAGRDDSHHARRRKG